MTLPMPTHQQYKLQPIFLIDGRMFAVIHSMMYDVIFNSRNRPCYPNVRNCETGTFNPIPNNKKTERGRFFANEMKRSGSPVFFKMKRKQENQNNRRPVIFFQA